MFFSPPKLHPPVLKTDEHRNLVRDKIEALASRRPKSDGRVADGSRVIIPLTTVAMSGNFDSYIQVQFPIPGGSPVMAQLLVDSGNDCLVVPHSEALVQSGAYKFWGAYTEPFGCPAYLLQGPLQIPTLDGSVYEIENCVFYACYKDNSWNPSLGRTANFGAGRVIPWPTMMVGPPPQTELTLACPFAYNNAYSFVEFIYGPAAAMSFGGGPLVTDGSFLVLNSYMPSGYTMMEIIPDGNWMSVVPTSLTINGTLTSWPSGTGTRALIDTGGGPVLVSDPNGQVNLNPWPDRVPCPPWTSGNYPNCNCTSAALQLGFVGYDNVGAYNYSIDTSGLPTPVQGLTSVVYNPGPGPDTMNIGGLSLLFNRLLVEYAGSRIGLLPQTPSWPPTIEMSASVNQPVAVSSSGVLLGYDSFDPGILTTKMTVSWSDLPAGATIRIKHDGSDGAQIVSWTGPDRSTQASGSLTATFMINLNKGAAVPVYIYVFGYEYLPLNIRLTATTS